MIVPICVALYLIAIVAANGLVAAFGQIALPITATLLIPFDLITRDVLHNEWEDDCLWPKMLALIGAGTALSALMSPVVALASACAFAAAGITNAIIYVAMPQRLCWLRMNVSNAFAAVVDSIVFPALAFDSLDIKLCVLQALCKMLGGCLFTSLFLWSAKRANNR